MGKLSLRAAAAEGGQAAGSSRLRTIPPPSGGDPAVLVVGGMTGFLGALTEALLRHKVFVGTVRKEEVAKSVQAAPPDLILLADDVAQESDWALLRSLEALPAGARVPIAILDGGDRLDLRLEAFRHGATAVIRKSPSMDAVATEVARLVRELPSRKGRALGELGAVTFEELIETVAQELRSGILSVRARGQALDAPVRLVLGGGRPISAVIDEFVERLGHHVISAEPLEYEFDQRSLSKIPLADPVGPVPMPGSHELQGVRVLLVDDDTARADAIAQELRRWGILVGVTDLEPSPLRLARLRELDPSVLLIGETHLAGAGYGLVQRMRGDLRLRWASLLLVDWSQIWPEDAASPTTDRLIASLCTMVEPERALRHCLDAGGRFEARLETTGPGRLLRALAESKRNLRVTLHNPRAVVQVDVADGLLVGAEAEIAGGAVRTLAGAPALAALVGLSVARIRVEPVEQPAMANLMATPDVALGMAGVEIPAIPPSIPPTYRGDSGKLGAGWPVSPRARTWLVAGALGGQLLLLGVVGGLVAAVRAQESHSSATQLLAIPASASAPQLAPVLSPLPQVPARAPGSRPNSRTNVGGRMVPSASPAVVQDPCQPWRGGEPSQEGETLKLATRALVRGDSEVALHWFCVAVDREPTSLDALLGLSRLLLVRGDHNGALRYAEQADRAHPGESRIQLLVGDAQAALGSLDQARKAWAQAYGLEPNDLRGMRGLAQRQLALGAGASREKRFSDAARFFLRAALVDSASLDAKLALAGALLTLREPEASARWATQATESHPASVGAWLILAEAYDRSGQPDQGSRALQRVLELNPGNAEAVARLRLRRSR